MTKDEFDLMRKQMNEQGLTDDQIMQVLYDTFCQKKCDINDYELMVEWMGYELTDEFYEEHGIKRNRK